MNAQKILWKQFQRFFKIKYPGTSIAFLNDRKLEASMSVFSFKVAHLYQNKLFFQNLKLFKIKHVLL